MIGICVTGQCAWMECDSYNVIEPKQRCKIYVTKSCRIIQAYMPKKLKTKVIVYLFTSISVNANQILMKQCRGRNILDSLTINRPADMENYSPSSAVISSHLAMWYLFIVPDTAMVSIYVNRKLS